MRRRLAVLLIFGTLTAAAFASPLTVDCLNGNITGLNFINVTGCLIPGGGSFTGKVMATLTGRSLTLSLTGTFTGSNVGSPIPFAKAPYPFAPADGVLGAFMFGSLTGNAAFNVGGEFFQLAGFATSFNNNSAIAFWSSPGRFGLPLPVFGSGGRRGHFAGPGLLEMFVRFNIPGGERISFPAGIAIVPEPGTMSLLGTGLIALASMMRRKFGG